MTDLAAIARWMRELAREPLLSDRVVGFAAVVVEPRGQVVAARHEIAAGYADARAALVETLGAPTHEGLDRAGVAWCAYREPQAVVLLAQAGEGARLHLEPFGRPKLFDGITPDVATWLASRRELTASTAEDRMHRRSIKRAIRRGGRVLPRAATRALLRDLRELATRLGDRAGCAAFATERGWLLDADHPHAGPRYLVPDGAMVHVGLFGEHAMVVLAEDDDAKRTKPATLARHHDEILEDVTHELGAPVADGSAATARWELFQLSHAIALLVMSQDPRGDGGRAVALYVVPWSAAVPAIEGDPLDWVNRHIKSLRTG